MSLFDILSWLFVVVMFIYQWPKVKAAFLKSIGSNKKLDIDNDPVIKSIDKKIGDLNRAAADEIRNDPTMLSLFKKAGIEITGGYGDDEKNKSTTNKVFHKNKLEEFIPSRAEKLYKKYGEYVTKKILDKEVWIEMNEEQLIESRSTPTHVEKEITKDLTKETWIYGNKISGSYFELENGKVVKIVER